VHIRKRDLLLVTLLIFTCTALTFGAAFFYLGNTNANNAIQQNQVTKDVVISRIEEETFIVTRTVYLDEEVNIKIDRGSDWDEFLWGKEINAEARVRVDVGVDMSKLTADDIEIDSAAKVVKVKAPKASVLDASISNKLKVESQGTILTRLFDDNYNDNYKLASEQLINSANGVVNGDSELLSEARNAASDYLSFLFQDLGYKLELV
jgi:hypothetical protein